MKSDPSASLGQVKLAIRDRESDKIRKVEKNKFIKEIEEKIKKRK